MYFTYGKKTIVHAVYHDKNNVISHQVFYGGGGYLKITFLQMVTFLKENSGTNFVCRKIPGPG